MKITAICRKHAFSAALIIALTASLATFLAAYRLDFAHAFETASLARTHWLYAIEMNDDMAVIDWSKNLGYLDNVKAFQVSVDGKITASGGNQTLLPASFREGVFFVFPDSWSYGWRDTPLQKNTREMIMVFRFHPGPVLLSILVFLACAATGFVAGFRVSSNASPSTPIALKDSESVPTRASSIPPSVKMEWNDAETAVMFLDKQFIIRLVSPKAASLMGRDSERFLNSHLLDLSPDPRLMKAIENAEQTRLSDAFPSRPGLCVRLKPDPQGIFLYLEQVDKTSSI